MNSPKRLESEEYKATYRHNSRINIPKIMQRKLVPCPDCGLRWHPSVMTFDHIGRNKAFDLNKVVWYDPATFDEELAKGEFVCQNCHIVREIKRDAIIGKIVDKFKLYYLKNLSIRGGILRHGTEDINYEIRF